MLYEKWPYLGVFLWLMACSLGLPLPEDVALLTGGFLCHQELARLELMIPVAMIGVLGGDFVLYGIGRRFGHHVTEHRLIRRAISPTRLAAAEKLFQRHGVKIIFAGRFLPGLRGAIFMAAGVLKVSFWKFAAVNGFAACISVPTLVVLGKVFGNKMDQIKTDVRTASHFIVLAVLLAALVGIGIYLHRREKRVLASTKAADPEANDDPGSLTA